MLLVAKALVFVADDARADAAAVDALGAAAIAGQEGLCDPQWLRPLPLSGIPGWHHRVQDERFYAEAGCFRPLRSGREYPAPLAVPD